MIIYSHRLRNILITGIVALLIIIFIAPLHVHASSYRQHLSINDVNVSVTKNWDDNTKPEPVDVTMSYSTLFELGLPVSNSAEFPDSVEVYYGNDYCGTAVKLGPQSDGYRYKSQKYSVTLGIPFHFSSYDETTRSETIKLEYDKFTFSFDNIKLSSDSNPSYKTGDFRVYFYDFFLNENHDNNDEVVFNESIMKSTFCEKSASGTSYDFTVERSLSDVVEHLSDNEELIIHNLKFTVTNSKKPAGKLDLTAHKTVNDGEPGQDDYFTFYLKDENGNILQIKQNDSDGNIKFDPINYNLDDIGKEFTYQVEEMKGSEENVTYDSSIYTVKVTPYQDPNDRSNIIADPTITKDGEEVSKIAFNNAVDKEQDDVSVTVKWDDYTDPEALDVTMSYSGAFTLHYSGSDTVTFPDSIKVYYGDEYCGTAVKSESISDQIRQTAALRKYVSGKINSGSGSVQRGQTQQYSVSLDLPLHYDSYDTATKSETIHIDPEKFNFSADGISLNNNNKFSNNEFSVRNQDLIDLDTVENSTFTESSASGIKYDFSVKKSRSDLSEPIGGGATMTTQALNFTLTNSLKSAGALRLKAKKTVNNGRPDQSYTFNLLDEDGNILQTKQNDPDGNIKFDPIHYDSTDIGKEYIYQVVEKRGSDKNTAYDSSVYTVKVTPYRDPDDPYTVIADPVITKDGEEVSEITFNNKVNNRKPVKTGDSSKTILWAIVLISAAAAFSIALRKREHE